MDAPSSSRRFPRTVVGGVELSRLICGSNWFLGFSHTSKAKDRTIAATFDTPEKIARVIEVFARYDCNAVMGPANELLARAIRIAQDRTGVKIHFICTPSYKDYKDPLNTWKPAVDESRKMGATFCFPHQCVTDNHLDRAGRRLDDHLMEYLRYIRESGMLPGLSAHCPEAAVYADRCGADVVSYIQIYNAAGFLCQVETDWIQRIIHEAKKPVMTIKPLAAGRLLPPTGLAFVWNTIRDCDLVTLGTFSPYEAEEGIELSLACLERRRAQVELQSTRSKADLKNA